MNKQTIITAILSIIIILQSMYYFDFQKQFLLAGKIRNMWYSSNIDVLTLQSWSKKTNFPENVQFDNNILSLDNTFGHAKDSFYIFVNRTDAILYKKGTRVQLQLKKTKGDQVSINFATAVPENKNHWWIMLKGFKIEVRDKGDLYVNYFVENRKNKDELYYIGVLPMDGFITFEFLEDEIVSLKDRKENEIGRAMFSDNPFKGTPSFYVGLTAGPNSALEVSHFRILTP